MESDTEAVPAPPAPRKRGHGRSMASIIGLVATLGAAAGFLSGPGSADAPTGRSTTSAAAAQARSSPARTRTRSFPGLDPLRHRVEDGVAHAELSDGSTAILSLEPGLQAHMEGVFARYEVPFGALIAMEPSTGRVLAYVSHSSEDPNAGDLVLDPSPPAASVFKIITAAALVDAGVSPTEQVPYHGGVSRVVASHLDPDPSRDRQSGTLGDAMGGSINVIFARLADQNLDAPTLERYASAFGFGHALPFDVPTRASAREVPSDRLERARTAAGFWHMHLSPFHGALVAATIANDGQMPRATLVDRVIDPAGRVTYNARPETFRSVVPRATARAVGQMMRRTTSRGGTAHRAFFDPQGNAFLPGIDVAGKTGTLAGSDPYRGYTWFVGFAPADEPTIAVAALVVNTPRWRIKGSFAGREALRYHLIEAPRRAAAAARAAAQAETSEAE